MYTCAVRPEIASLSAYVPGMSIAEVRERYGLSRVIKMASKYLHIPEKCLDV